MGGEFCSRLKPMSKDTAAPPSVPVWYAPSCRGWGVLEKYSRLNNVVNKRHEIKMGKWQLSGLIIHVKYLNEVCSYTRRSVWTRTAIWHQAVLYLVAINTTNWYVNVCWPNDICVCVFKTQVTGAACAHDRLYNYVVRSKKRAADVTTLAASIDNGLNLSKFSRDDEENAVTVLLMKWRNNRWRLFRVSYWYL
jgi:hypothetical protein